MILSLLLLAFMLLATPVIAADKYASPSGSGPAPACAQNNPCSLSACVNATNAGDRCLLLDTGTPFTDTIHTNMGMKSGTSWNPGGFVTIAGAPGQRPTVRPSSAGIIVSSSSTVYKFILFENLIIDATVASGGMFFYGTAVSDLKINNIEIKNASQSGIEAYMDYTAHTGIQRLEFSNLNIHNSGTRSLGDTSSPPDHGMYVCGPDMIIRDNTLWDNSGYGLQFYDTQAGNNHCGDNGKIYNNRIFANRQWGVNINFGANIQFFNNLVYSNTSGGVTPISNGANNAQIYNNTIFGNGGDGISTTDRVTDVKIRNNIIANNNSPVSNAGTNTTFSNNLCWSNGGFGNLGTGCTHSGDPKFVAPGTGISADFSLQADSSAINIGANLSPVVTTDRIGTARPQPSGGMYDVGAYERLGTGGGPGPGPDPCPPNCPTTCPPDCPVEPPPAMKAFPTAEGYGVNTVGGRGTSSQPGRTIEVTNLLDDDNPGSFRYCVQRTGPRTCVFRIGGTIPLSSPLNIDVANSFLTIAGQTAPGGGIQTKNWYFQIKNGAHDVIIRHMKFRPGTDHTPSDINNQCGGIILYGPSGGANRVYNIMIDHVSIEWSCDDSLNASGLVQDTTVQWTIIGDGMNSSDYCHPTDVPPQCANSKGFLIGDFVDQTITFHHNMILTSESRNPAVAGANILDFRNNLIYNWYACYGGSSFGNQPAGFTRVNYIGNKTIVGPSTGNLTDCRLGEIDYEGIDMYAIDNSTPWCERDGNCSTATFAQMGFIGPARLGNPTVNELQARVSTPFTVPAVATTPVANLEALLTSKVGATVPSRDTLDTSLISEMTGRTGTRGRGGVPWPTLAAGSAPADADHDGMPDSWEDAHSLNKNEAGDAAQISTNGYSNLENYLNTLAGDTVDPGAPAGNRVSPGTFYVALNGVDPPTRDCTTALNDINAPFLSVDAGRSCLTVAGDKLFLRQGSYTTGLTAATQPITNGTDWDHATTIGSYGTETATLVLASAKDVALYFNSNNQYIILDRLIIDCHNQTNSNGLAMTPGTHHVRFQNGEIKSCHFEPIYNEGSDNNEILNSIIHGSVVASCINLTAGSDNTTIRNNTIYGCAEAGIEASGANTNTSIRNNVIHDVGSANTLAGIALTGATTPEIINNVAYANYRGVQLLIGTSNAKVYNNTLNNNLQQGLLIDTGVTGTAATNNIVADNSVAQIVNNGGTTTQTTNITVAPPFDPAFPNKFHLTAAATTAINVGTSLATDVPTDYEGVARPQGAGFDIGASEFIATVVPPAAGAIQGPYWRGQGFLWR